MLVDTHTHIYLNQFDEDRIEVINRAIQAGVTKMFLPDIDSKTRAQMFELAEKHKGVLFPMCGLHPTSVKNDYKIELDKCFSCVKQYKNSIVAIGEVGIDLYWDKTYLKEQIDVLSAQIDLALEEKLPIIIHMRDSFNEIWDLLSIYHSKLPKILFHCFSGNLQQAKLIVEKGYLLGIGGVLTYKNSVLKDVVKNISIKSIVLETDAPYLAPVPFRGKRNEPSYIVQVASELSNLINLSYDEVCINTTNNVMNFFNLN